MSDAAAGTATDTSTTTPTTTDTGTPPAGTDTDTTDWKTEAEKWKDLSRKHEDRAKQNAGLQKELDELRRSSMSDQEKAVDLARSEARNQALTEVGGRLAAAEIRVKAAGRLDDAQLATLVEGLNLAVFLTAEGEVDEAKVAAFVDGIAPAKSTDDTGSGLGALLDLGQGARGGGSDSALNGDPLLKDLKNKLGIRS